MQGPGFSVQTSNRMADLAAALADALALNPPPPLAEEVVIVQSQGMRRWLTLELARHLGVAGSLSMPFPGGFCHRLADSLTGSPPLAESASAFDRTNLTFRIMAVLDEMLTDGRFRGVATYLSSGAPAKRIQLCARLANLYDDYMVYRPEMLLDWERGSMGTEEDGSDWQAELWRRLTVGLEEEHLASRFLRLTAELEGAEEAPANLPHRLAVFGVSSLPPVFLNLLAALARWIPVQCFLFDCGYVQLGDEEPRNRLAQGLGPQGR
ncbi:MAG: exodeoxyribonuclease V subunit gamma, partial [Planctomycetota bacterium]